MNKNNIIEDCVKELEKFLDTQTMLLMCGEMTSGELLTVRAIINDRIRAIRALKDPE